MKEIPKAIVEKFKLLKTNIQLEGAPLYRFQDNIFFYKPTNNPNWLIRIVVISKNKAHEWEDFTEDWCLKVSYPNFIDTVLDLYRKASSKSQLPFGMVPDELGLYDLALYGQYDTRTGLIKCKPAQPSLLQRIKNVFQ